MMNAIALGLLHLSLDTLVFFFPVPAAIKLMKRLTEKFSSHLSQLAIAKSRCKSSLNHQAALTKSVSLYFPLSAVDSVGQQQ